VALSKRRGSECRSQRLRRKLESGATSGTAVAAQPPARSRSLVWAVVTILAVLSAGYVFRKGSGETPPIRFPQSSSFSSPPRRVFTSFRLGRPTEKSFAYSREVNGFKKVFVKALQGEPQQLTAGSGDDIQPKWAPDGQSILFVRSTQPRGKLEPGDVFGQYEGGDIWKKDLASGKEEKFLDKAFNPSFSPDGKTPRRSMPPGPALGASGSSMRKGTTPSKLRQTAPKPLTTWSRTGLPTARTSSSRIWNERNSA